MFFFMTVCQIFKYDNKIHELIIVGVHVEENYNVVGNYKEYTMNAN